MSARKPTVQELNVGFFLVSDIHAEYTLGPYLYGNAFEYSFSNIAAFLQMSDQRSAAVGSVLLGLDEISAWPTPPYYIDVEGNFSFGVLRWTAQFINREGTCKDGAYYPVVKYEMYFGWDVIPDTETMHFEGSYGRLLKPIKVLL